MKFNLKKIVPGETYQVTGPDIQGVHKLKRLISNGERIMFLVDGCRQMYDREKHEFRLIAASNYDTLLTPLMKGPNHEANH